jgi:long-chain fatty acid transport protein
LATVGLNFADPAISTRIRENWHDALSLRIGAEWRKSEKLALRGGWYYDESPQPTQAVDPLLPDTDRNGLSRGVGFNVGGLHLDAYGLVLIVSERSTRGTSLRGYDGTYASSALIGGLNATYRF